jgi:hypothetical protein
MTAGILTKNLGVFFDPSLPQGENFASNLAISASYRQDVESFVVAENDQTEATVDGLHVGKVDAFSTNRVLNVYAVCIDGQGWSPKHEPSGETERHQNCHNAQAQARYHQVHCNGGSGKYPDQQGRELIRRRPDFIRRHLVIVTDKVQVCA